MQGIGDVVSQVYTILALHSQYISQTYAFCGDTLDVFASGLLDNTLYTGLFRRKPIKLLDAYALLRYAVVALHLDTRPWSVLRGGQSRSRRQSCWVVWEFDHPQPIGRFLIAPATRSRRRHLSVCCPPNPYTHWPNKHTPPSGSQSPFQVPSAGSAGGGGGAESAGPGPYGGAVEVMGVPNRQVPGHGPYQGRVC
jgi:hypothetical protein